MFFSNSSVAESGVRPGDQTERAQGAQQEGSRPVCEPCRRSHIVACGPWVSSKISEYAQFMASIKSLKRKVALHHQRQVVFVCDWHAVDRIVGRIMHSHGYSLTHMRSWGGVLSGI